MKISKENYDYRKKDFENRINSVIHYATNNTVCRSRQLLMYFGETDSPECGICDFCKAMQNFGLSSFEFNEISKQIKSILEKPVTYETLLLKLKGNREKSMNVLKWLIDNKKIVFRVDQKLEWKE